MFFYKMQYIDRISKLIVPYNTEFKKMRIGSQDGDGGYVVSDIPDYKYSALYSYGCNDEITFEKSFHELYNVDSYTYDHTIDNITNKPEYIHFFKQGVASTKRKDEVFDTIDNHIINNNHKNLNNLFLQMDIEGSEWEVLFKIPNETLLKFSQMCIEFHMWGPMDNIPLFTHVFEKINKHFVCTHVHGNNFCIERYNEIPKVIEVSYIRRDLVKDIHIDNRFYPTELDKVNNIHFKDLKMGWWVN